MQRPSKPYESPAASAEKGTARSDHAFGGPKGDAQGDGVISFGPFSVIKARRLMERAGEPVPIGSRAFDILVHLLEHRGQVVSHGALLAAAWPDTIVEEGSLRFQMVALRKALGRGESAYNYIINVPGRGYCFAAPISRRDEVDAYPVLVRLVRPKYSI